MTEIRVHRGAAPADRFMIVTNEFMRGELPVPLKALPRVLLGYFLSLPTGWRITRAQIDGSVEEGRDAVDKGLKELETAGYLQRTRRRGQGGKWVWTYAITDDPKARPLASPSPESQGMDPTSEKGTNPQVAPSPGSPGTVDQGIRTEVRSKKKEELGTDVPEPVLDLPGVPAVDELAKRRLDRRESESVEPTLNQRANLLAGRHYERLGKMGNVPAFMKIIRKALEHEWPDGQVDIACAWIAEHQWTLTEERLANTLRGGPKRAGGPAPTTTRPEVRTGRMILET